MTHQQELDEARAEMIFREEQLHWHSDNPCIDAASHLRIATMAREVADKASDRYLALLAEKRIRDLREVTA